ncbi:MAG: copper amine oxidase N-terminal domain-containing protein [Defluviitaleaceae bacterium]|nr:copper amine oxidase N-terminal domain-containing protein [Defluviitaleaceae bacterium]
MKNASMKLRYFVAGLLVATILSTGVVAFASPETRQLFFGVNVVVDGEALELEGINRPFILDGRTFLPVAVIAEVLGIPVEWDGDTTTVYIGINTPFLGHWEVIAMSSLTEEELQLEIEAFGAIEITFFAGGVMNFREGRWLDWYFWTAEDGIITISDDTSDELIAYSFSGEYLVLTSVDYPDDYIVLRPIGE